MDKHEKKAAVILAAIAGFEGVFVVLNLVSGGGKFVRFLGFAGDESASALGWVFAAFTAALFIFASLRLPSVRENMFRPGILKVLAIVLAIFAGILEELVFRKVLMDSLASRGWGIVLQIVTSGVAFGVAHAVWGIFGRDVRAAAGAAAATTLLGLALAGVYVAAGRNLAPCIIAHLVINLLIEPGLVLAAVRGELALSAGGR